MATWAEIEAAVPEFATKVRERFDAHRHKTMATVRKDGSPRISGTEVEFRDGQMWLGGLYESRKALDLRRDPRVAIHTGSDEPDRWQGDAKVSGRAVEITDPDTLAAFAQGAPPGPFHLFRVDISEAVFLRGAEGGDHLIIDHWHADRGLSRVERR